MLPAIVLLGLLGLKLLTAELLELRLRLQDDLLLSGAGDVRRAE